MHRSSENCDANFYFVVTHEPDVLLKKWHARDQRLFSGRNGRGAIDTFLDSSLPLRIAYNSDLLSEGGILDSPEASSAALVGSGLDRANVPTNAVHSPTRLRYGGIAYLSSVIIVVDANRIQGLTFGQLADYVAMMGLAQVRPDVDTGATPTILKLFKDPQDRPAALSNWDEAFPSSLYGSDQGNVTQLSSMERCNA